MSATRDKTQKTTFVYSNLYQLYRKGKDTAQAAPESALPSSFFQLPSTLPSEKNVLKSHDLKHQAAPQVSAYNPPAFIAKRVVEKPSVLAQANPSQSAAIRSLKDNLKSLNDLHARLRFMLQELEELTKE